MRHDNKPRVLVFVHGLGGDPENSWRCPNGKSWPRLLTRDTAFDNFDIYLASYDTRLIGNQTAIDEAVATLQNRLENDGVFDYKEIVFVAHSLGGLVVKRLLLTRREYAAKVRFIYLFSTPSTGAAAANVASFMSQIGFSDDPLLKEMKSGDNEYLFNLEAEWKAAPFKNVKQYCAYETQLTHGVRVVDRLSGTRDCDQILPIGEDHFNIVKPCHQKHDSYIALRNAVRENPLRVAPTSVRHPGKDTNRELVNQARVMAKRVRSIHDQLDMDVKDVRTRMERDVETSASVLGLQEGEEKAKHDEMVRQPWKRDETRLRENAENQYIKCCEKTALSLREEFMLKCPGVSKPENLQSFTGEYDGYKMQRNLGAYSAIADELDSLANALERGNCRYK